MRTLIALGLVMSAAATGCGAQAGPVRRVDVTPVAALQNVSARGCPVRSLRRALPLPADAVARAAEMARHSGNNDPRTVVVASALATSPAAGTRGSQVRWQCGWAIARRTVVVDLSYPWMRPSASLSQGTLFVSYFQRGYRVWEVTQ